MEYKYTPILKSKQGELKALSKLKPNVKDLILPLFEIDKLSERIKNSRNFSTVVNITCAYLDQRVLDIQKYWGGRAALVDIYQWQPDAITETGEHVISYLYKSLISHGVHLIPVVGYDRWECDSYKIALMGCDTVETSCCLRLDSHAIEDAAEPDFFEEQITAITNGIGIERDRCIVLIDFNEIIQSPVDELLNNASRLINLLTSLGFSKIITAGCSLPSTINLAVKVPDSTAIVLRKEMVVWQTLKQLYPDEIINFGDYGIRNPNIEDGIIAPNMNGKIRYTIDKNIFILRGHSIQREHSFIQMHHLAKELINSKHYLGRSFSNGDEEIYKRANRLDNPGNATTWISIDTNHHISYVTNEVLEFEKLILHAQSRNKDKEKSLNFI